MLLREELRGYGPVSRWTAEQCRHALDVIARFEGDQRPFVENVA